MKRYKSELTEDYKTVFKGTKLEIKNVDRSFGRLVGDEIANFVKNQLEEGTNLKVYSITIDCQ